MKNFRFIVYLTLATLFILAAASVTYAQDSEESSEESTPILPQMECAALMGSDFSQLADAPTQIVAAGVVTETNSTYCQVTGYSAPQTHFEVRLPMTSWTGRYAQLGCGGFCGYDAIAQKLEWQGDFGTCAPDNLPGFVIGSTDGGHFGSGDAQWAFGSPQLRIDWAYRSEHMMVTVANALMTSFYGQEPSYRYFAGCSNGGRQALMMAQRYPSDFDGILAGAPAHAFPPLMIQFAWNAQANTNEEGNQILTDDSFPVLHQAVLAACDGNDGVTDGVLDDPRACDFDPAVVECSGDNQEQCLTPAQVEVARKLYNGPVDANGKRLYPGGLPYGSEMEWTHLFFGWNPPTSRGFNEELASHYLRYLATWDEPLSVEGLRFDMAPFNKLAEMSSLYDATDPDLSAFRDSGGKLIIWHGWEDASIPPQGTLSYYQALQDEMGGLEETQQFARLYMIPGLGHCVGGSALPQFEFLTPLVEWVEQDVAPEEVMVEMSDEEGATRTRPLYPYPTVARYDGSGSEDRASNFRPSTPDEVNDAVAWAGQFRSGYQQWCRVEGTEVQCQEVPFE
jgi:feruloyl esterase